MKRSIRLWMFVASAVWLAGATCAPYQKVGIESSPAAAEIYVDGDLVGETPAEVRVPTGEDHSVFIKKQGYKSRLVVLNRNEPQDGIDFLTPADIRVRLVPLTDPKGRELEVEVEKKEAE